MQLHRRSRHGLRAAIAWALLTVAPVPMVHGYSQQYCSPDNTGLSDTHKVNIYNTNLACYNQCAQDYAVAIMQWQGCWCSNYLPADQVPVSECNEPCPAWKSDHCGNQTLGLFGYMTLNLQPSGTASNSNPLASSTLQPSTTAEPTSQTTSSSEAISTTSTISSTPSPSSTTTSSSSATTEPMTSQMVVIISGSTITQTVTTTPTSTTALTGGQIGSNANASGNSSGGHLSSGAAAGIAIGAVVGAAAIAFASFLLWRRNRAGPDGASSRSGFHRSPTRNVSVLSRSGLIARGGVSAAATAAAAAAMTERDDDGGTNSVRHSMLFSPLDDITPVSPLGSSHGSDGRRHSRPMVYDQRLNPSALFANAEANGSRISMQDQQDYSRPLGVTNPDPRASFESRV